jgi:hypothetical protein
MEIRLGALLELWLFPRFVIGNFSLIFGFREVGFKRRCQLLGHGSLCHFGQRFGQLLLGVQNISQFIEKQLMQFAVC